MSKLDTICPGEGLEGFRFPATRDRIIEEFGVPEAESSGAIGLPELRYPSLGLTFTFPPPGNENLDQDRAIWLTTNRRDSEIRGENLMDFSAGDLKYFFEKTLHVEIEISTPFVLENGVERITADSEELGLLFCIDDGRVSTINVLDLDLFDQLAG